MDVEAKVRALKAAKRAAYRMRADVPFYRIAGGVSRWVEWVEAMRWRRESEADERAYPSRVAMYAGVAFDADLLDRPIRYMEFGVGSGKLLSVWTKINRRAESRFEGYDSFEGLPGGWWPYEAGAFAVPGVPEIEDDRVRFIVGSFDRTVVEVGREEGVPWVVHVDSDLPESAVLVFSRIFPHLRIGDVVILDEFAIGRGEFRVFREFSRAYRYEMRLLGTANEARQAAFICEGVMG